MEAAGVGGLAVACADDDYGSLRCTCSLRRHRIRMKICSYCGRMGTDCIGTQPRRPHPSSSFLSSKIEQAVRAAVERAAVERAAAVVQ